MISRLWSSTKPSMASKECCRPPGESTERRERSRRNRASRNPKTSSSMAKEFEMGACGYLGSKWSVRRNAVTGPWNRPFRNSVNQSCSGIRKLLALSSWLLAWILDAHAFPLSFFSSDPASYSGVQFINRFAGDGSDRQKQARQQTTKAGGKTNQDTIRGGSQQ